MADVISVAAKYDAFAAQVQAIGATAPPPVLAIGARCKVTKSPSAVIRATADPNAPSIGPQYVGAQGTVVAPGLVNGGWWVNFDVGVGRPGWIWASNIVAI